MISDKIVKEVWAIRFQKIIKVEKEGFLFYRRLLRKNKVMFEGTKAKAILESMTRDELKHFRIAQELLRILKDQK